MSKIDKLIRELCPDGVEFKPVEAVAELKRGTSITKKHIQDGDVPVIAGGQKPAYYHNQSNRSGETIVIAGSGAYAGFVTFWDIPIFVSDAFTVVTSEDLALPKYVYYFLKSKQSFLHDMQRGGGVPHVYAKDVAPIKMPVPPLEVQKEIVNILDKFTQLEAELSAELDARRKQYEYYRNQLLTFDESVSVKHLTLGDLGRIVTGRTPKSSEKDYWGNDTLFVTPSDIKTGSKFITTTTRQLSEKGALAMKSNVIPAKSILVTCIGSDMGKTVVNDRECVTNQQINSIILDDGVSSDYIYHLLASKISYLKALGAANGSTMPIINKSLFSKIEIELPPLKMQLEIAKLLDKFDLLVNDIQQGLPAEIEARRNQYEYYRTKLLTFQELPA